MNELYVLVKNGTAIACSSSQHTLKEHVGREAKNIRASYEWKTIPFHAPKLLKDVECEWAVLKIDEKHVHSYMLYNIAYL